MHRELIMRPNRIRGRGWVPVGTNDGPYARV
jgi:hypothetical protein